METKANISGDRWTIRVVTPKQMKKHRNPGDPDAGGLCIPSEKLILIDEDCVDYETICHEIGHSYWSYLHLEDTNTIPLCDIEEITCSLFAAKGEKMIRQAKRITKDLKKLIGGQE